MPIRLGQPDMWWQNFVSCPISLFGHGSFKNHQSMTNVNLGLKCRILKHIVNITIAVKNIKGTACEYYSNEVFCAVDGTFTDKYRI